MTKEERDEIRKCMQQAQWIPLRWERSVRLMAFDAIKLLDALDAMEAERDEALVGVESGKRAALMCRELTDALLAIEALGAEDESAIEFVQRKLDELDEARAACLARADERDEARAELASLREDYAQTREGHPRGFIK